MSILKRTSTLLAVAVAGLVMTAGTATAATGNPHFIKNATSASISGPSLTVKFKEAGLASGSVETVQIGATAATTYACVNGGDKNPTAATTRSFTTAVTQSGTFTADKNGNIVGSLTLSPPSASSLGFSCPPGQTVTFISVTYTNVSVTDLTSGATLALPGTFSYTNPNAPRLR